ncbi:MAG: hypothetical protein AAF386_13690, partial [Pseudomonadota bacterium]
MTPRTGLYFAIYALFAILIAWLFYGWVFNQARADIRATAEIRLEQAAGRLRGQLQTYRVLINAIARDPRVVTALQDQTSAASIASTLERQRLTFGAEEIDLIAADGHRVASANR